MILHLTACLGAALLAPAAAQLPQSEPISNEKTAQPAVAPPSAAASAAGARPESPWPGQWLADVCGPSGLAALQARGHILLQGKPGAYRLQKIFWKPLETLARNTKNIQQFGEAWSRIQAGEALAPAGPLPFLALAQPPADGLLTPPLHALLEAMAAYHSEWTALSGPQDEAAAPAMPAVPGPNLFDTAWGQAFAARTHADVVADSAPVVDAYFDSFLAGVQPWPQAVAHFTGCLRDRYQIDVSSRLAADARSGSASPELRGLLRRYLIEQRRFHALASIRRQTGALERKTALARDLQDLETAAAVFRGRPGLIAELEGVVQAAPPAAAAPELTSAGLHLAKPLKLGQHELGDTITLSGAYWIDGLPASETVTVEETTYRETPEGPRDVQSRTVRRADGGPYTFSRRLVLTDSAPFTFHSVISAPSGNTLDDSLSVVVTKDFELALLQLAAADDQRLSCAFPDAVAAYDKLAASLADAASEKPQYRDLLAAVRRRREETARAAEKLARLTAAIPETRADTSPEQCRYDLRRTQAALDLAQSLPAGCDPRFADLRRQRALISRRAADQQSFAAHRNLAAARRRSCNFGLAAEELARGLAILRADPAARCGETAAAARQAEADLPTARAGELWRTAFDENLRLAQTEAAPAKRLAVLEPLIARIGSLDNPACFAPQRAQAEKLAQAAGAALTLPDALAARLPEDAGLSTAVAEVTAQRRQLVAEAAALQTKQAAEQSPTGKGPLSRPGDSPPPGPAAKTTTGSGNNPPAKSKPQPRAQNEVAP